LAQLTPIRIHGSGAPVRTNRLPAQSIAEGRLGRRPAALFVNRDWFQNEAFLVAHADNLTDFVVAGLIAANRDRPPGHVMTMLGFRTDDPSTFSSDFRSILGTLLHSDRLQAEPSQQIRSADTGQA
jgi:hypothetical protein